MNQVTHGVFSHLITSFTAFTAGTLSRHRISVPVGTLTTSWKLQQSQQLSLCSVTNPKHFLSSRRTERFMIMLSQLENLTNYVTGIGGSAALLHTLHENEEAGVYIDGLGTVKYVEGETGGYGSSEDVWFVFSVDEESLYRINGFYSSFDGVDWFGPTSIEEVEAEEKVVIVYNPKAPLVDF